MFALCRPLAADGGINHAWPARARPAPGPWPPALALQLGANEKIQSARPRHGDTACVCVRPPPRDSPAACEELRQHRGTRLDGFLLGCFQQHLVPLHQSSSALFLFPPFFLARGILSFCISNFPIIAPGLLDPLWFKISMKLEYINNYNLESSVKLPTNCWQTAIKNIFHLFTRSGPESPATVFSWHVEENLIQLRSPGVAQRGLFGFFFLIRQLFMTWKPVSLFFIICPEEDLHGWNLLPF